MRFIKNNALTLVLIALFFLFWAGQSIAGWCEANEQRQQHGQPTIDLGTYLESGHFWEATAENWESEFLQMAAFVFLSACLVQRGSAESKQPPDEEKAQQKQEDETLSRHSRKGERPPWPVRKGGIYVEIYSHSLSIALGLLFVGSFLIHAFAGLEVQNDELMNHGEPAMRLREFVVSPTFWFQSLQNWQSEFLSVGVLVVLTIFLRERGSPQSKPVEAPHQMTGPS
jgi:hypothetical protein